MTNVIDIARGMTSSGLLPTSSENDPTASYLSCVRIGLSLETLHHQLNLKSLPVEIPKEIVQKWSEQHSSKGSIWKEPPFETIIADLAVLLSRQRRFFEPSTGLNFWNTQQCKDQERTHCENADAN